MKFEIKSRWSGDVLFSVETESLKMCVEAGVKSMANLYGADLRGANLYGANLYGANLYGADLYGADLYGADLGGADLRGANLDGANLSRANLGGANLYGADLDGADLRGANLHGADLGGANLDGADATGKYFCLGPIGSRRSQLHGFATDKGVWLKTGCFNGTATEFLKQVKKTHGNNEHGKAYKKAVVLMRVMLGDGGD